jgi:DNA-3-methyladenine glycosylase
MVYTFFMTPSSDRPSRAPGRRGRILSRGFYAKAPWVAARALIGQILVRRIGGKTLAGRIVEAEAYSSDDPASHAYRGLTFRNRALFGEVGHAYIYQTHGPNFCLNAVARSGQPAGGVLIRALEPLQGIELMKKIRKTEDVRRLARGPGNLTRALRIDKGLYGIDLTKEGPLTIRQGTAGRLKIAATPRVGVTSARDKLWRFVLVGSPFVSRSSPRR